MSGTSANAIDRLRGPHDGVLELIIVQPSDWESDPFIVKKLRDKVSRYQSFLVGEEFRRTYSGCRGVIVLETPHFPPEEVQQILAKEGVEVRVAQVAQAPEGVDQVRETSAGAIELVIFQHQDWEADPFLVKKLRETAAAIELYVTSEAFLQLYAGRKSRIVVEATFAPPADIKGLLKKLSIEVRSADTPAAAPAAPAPQAQPAAPAPQAAAPAPQAAAAPEAPAKPMFIERKPDLSEDFESEIDNDPYDAADFGGAGAVGGSKPPMFFVGIGLAVVFGLGLLYGLFAGSSAPEVGSPKVIAPTSVSSKTLPKESYATITARPDRGTFVMIPIQSNKTGKNEFYFLFAAKDQRRLLIFASQAASQIVSKIKYVKHSVTGDKIPRPVWKSDLKGAGEKAQARTYTGRLEAAKRRKHGPVELVLPDNNRNVNKIYQRLGIKFPPDTMILVVGEKPHPPSGNGGIIAMICLIGLLVSGGVAFAANSSARRNF